MSDLPHDIQFALTEFDRGQLPESQRALEGDAFRDAVRDHLASQFVGQGGAAEVVVTSDRVIIRWKEDASPTSLAAQGAAHLREGNAEQGVAMLRLALDRDPDDRDALYNLGMALGDLGQTAESIELLEKLVTYSPGHPGAWAALGVARGRAGKWDEAILAFRQAVQCDAQDGLARKNLGAALSRTGRLEEGRIHLKAAVVLMENDPQAWLNLAMNLEESGENAEAEIAYSRAIAFDPGGHLAALAEGGRNRITSRKFKPPGQVAPRPDAVAFCRDAIRLFKDMPMDDVKRITMEIGMMGAKGLAVQSSAANYTLRSLPGSFSGLQLLCIEYAGFKLIDQSVDIGLDLSKEYEAAKSSIG